MELNSVIIILLGVLVLQNIIHARERRDLYSRIMARDLKDYNSTKKREPPKSRNFIRKGIEEGYDLMEGGDKQ